MKKKNIKLFKFFFYTDIIKSSKWDYWIGLSYSASLDNWKWSDGTPFSYSNWYKGEPNGKDHHCTYVCKKNTNQIL